MELNYKKYGEGERVLIILHGLFGSLDNWQSMGKRFSEKFTTYLVDQRNHGKSPHTVDHNYTLMAKDLEAFMDLHNIEKANILGHSMGGKTVMQFAIENPQRLERMVVADIAPKYYAPHHQQIIGALKSVNLDVLTDRKQVQDKISETIDNPGVVQFLMKGLTWSDKEKLTWKFNLKVLSEQIENIGEKLTGFAYFTNPTLFVRGENSDYITEEDLDVIEEIFPMAQYRTIDDAGHWLHAENPDQFFDEVISFLK